MIYAAIEVVVIAAIFGYSINQVLRQLAPGLHRRLWRHPVKPAAASCNSGCSSGGCGGCASAGSTTQAEVPLQFSPRRR